MNRFAMAIANVLAVIGLAGCAGTKDLETMDPDCEGSGGVCKVTVTAKACYITVAPSTLVIKKGVRNINISWELVDASEDYQFRNPDGIVLKTPDSSGQFSRPGATGGGKKFMIHDKNEESGRFEYGVNLLVRYGSYWYNCGQLDPTIVNQG